MLNSNEKIYLFKIGWLYVLLKPSEIDKCFAEYTMVTNLNRVCYQIVFASMPLHAYMHVRVYVHVTLHVYVYVRKRAKLTFSK